MPFWLPVRFCYRAGSSTICCCSLYRILAKRGSADVAVCAGVVAGYEPFERTFIHAQVYARTFGGCFFFFLRFTGLDAAADYRFLPAHPL